MYNTFCLNQTFLDLFKRAYESRFVFVFLVLFFYFSYVFVFWWPVDVATFFLLWFYKCVYISSEKKWICLLKKRKKKRRVCYLVCSSERYTGTLRAKHVTVFFVGLFFFFKLHNKNSELFFISHTFCFN